MAVLDDPGAMFRYGLMVGGMTSALLIVAIRGWMEDQIRQEIASQHEDAEKEAR